MPERDIRDREDFAELSRGGRSGFIGEFWAFLRHNKKWWLLPIVIFMILLGAIVFVSSSGWATFLYPLF